ncbi:hypothetical protein C8R48DRAFT_733923 [Suillus tomentosus]|nr:hypothetical protein C8R48DRAFT_733923 [Suillus tomentosus]
MIRDKSKTFRHTNATPVTILTLFTLWHTTWLYTGTDLVLTWKLKPFFCSTQFLLFTIDPFTSLDLVPPVDLILHSVLHWTPLDRRLLGMASVSLIHNR